MTLNNISLAPNTSKGGGALILDATARTFRYLDEEEIQQQRRASAKKGRKK